MNYDQLRFDFEHASSLKLLRSLHAPLIIAFLYAQFKRAQRLSVPFDDLALQLERFLEGLNEQQPQAYRSATAYLKEWADEAHRIVRIVSRGNGDFVELTADAERAIGWVEGLYRREFVGTESRFLSIFNLLEEIIARSTEDVPTRLEQLERQRDALQQEIDSIRAAGRVEPFTDTQIRERFLQAGEVARELVRDFAAVEQNFRAIAKALQERQVQPGTRKGALVGYVLDADAELRESDQGRSFYAFWEFLMSPSKQDELSEMLERVYALPIVREVARDHHLLRHVSGALIEAGGKVVGSNHRLAEQLRRLLDERVQTERRRVRELIEDIKRAALRLVDEGQAGVFLELEGSPELNLVMEKPLWEPSVAPVIEDRPLEGDPDLNEADFRALFKQFSVSEERLRERIEMLLADQPRCTLSDVLERFPLEQGLAEVITYMALASRDERHEVSETQHEMIFLRTSPLEDEPDDLDENGSGLHRSVSVPKITFRSADAR